MVLAMVEAMEVLPMKSLCLPTTSSMISVTRRASLPDLVMEGVVGLEFREVLPLRECMRRI
jgi:hypothetical protein